MPKILHTSRYTGVPWEILKSVVPGGFFVETLDNASYDCLLRQAEDADYLLVSGRLSIDERLLANAKRLKMIQRTGVGTEMLDLNAIRKRNIPVYVNRGINARSVAEHTLALMFCCLKNIPQIDRRVKTGLWDKQQTGVMCHEIYGKTVGLVGMGAIGQQVAFFLKAFGAKVLYTDLHQLDERIESDLNISYIPTFEGLLPVVDILSFHCPLTSDNIGMLNASKINQMKDGAVVINTARGKLIDSDSLYQALLSGKLRYAALDVHSEEPIKEDYLLASIDNIILTPHIAGLTYESFYSMMAEAINNIVAFDRGDKEAIKDKLLIQ